MQVWRNPDAFVATRNRFGKAGLAVVSQTGRSMRCNRKKPMEPVNELSLAAPCNRQNEAERNSMMEKARGVIVKLPAEQRKTLEMAFFDGLTHSEIAARAGKPAGYREDKNTQPDDVEKGLEASTVNISTEDLALFTGMQLLGKDGMKPLQLM